MRIKSEYIKEQKRYSIIDLMKIFHLNQQEVIEFIKKLKAYGVLKMVKSTSIQKDLSDLTDENIEIVDVDIDSEDYYYIFTFVGIVTVGNIIIKCYPKYLKNKTHPIEEMQQVIKVLNKYNSKEQIINLFSGDTEQISFNLLSIILFLLYDYYDYGLYTNQEMIIETNGEGEILWDNTINETFAIISNNIPYYTELQTVATVNDERDYFKRLHQCILTKCSKKLEKVDLLDLFEMESLYLSDEDLVEFGDIDYILYRIRLELNTQFITRKQRILKTLYTYVANSKSMEESFGLSMYGTNSFNLVWEKACSEVFDNKLDTQIGKLKLPIGLHDDYKNSKEKTLLEIIDKPTWRYFGQDLNYDNKVKDTLKPDLISIYEKEDGMYFGIFDAKYYNIKLTKNRVEGQPGVGDITKQYLYQLAYNTFIYKHGFKNVQNAFLMPTDEEMPILNGEAEMDILKGLSNPPLVNILVLKIPAKKVFNYYISGKKLNINEEYSFL